MMLTPSAHQDTFTRDNLPPADLRPTFEFTIPDVQYPQRLNAASMLVDAAVEKYGADRPALHTPDGPTWSYGDLQNRANQTARVLTEEYGLVPGNRVMLRGPNNPWQVAAWLGVLKAGGVVVTIPPLLRDREIARLVDLTQPTVLISDHRFADAARDLILEQAVQPTVLTYGSDSADDLVHVAALKPATFDAVDTAADDVALLAPTSGTTGVPKATMHFHRDILANADTFARHIIQPTPDDVWTCSAPFAFTFGLGCSVVFPLHSGGSALLVEKAAPVEFLEAAAEAGVTILATAPTAYRSVIKEGRASLLSRLRVGISAGEHLPKETWEAVHEASGLRLVNGIGSTELLHVFISATGDDIRPEAVGRPVPGFRARIIDPEGNEVPDGTPGRLAVMGPTGCRYMADERQRDYILDGWSVTGDTFIRDEDGYFIYQARSDNMIVSSGYNIGAPEVETAINLHEDVVENAVVGRPDPERGNVVCAFIILREGVEADDAKRREIQNFVKQQIAPFKYPRDIRFVSDLPRNTSGKIQHFKLREQVAQEQKSAALVSA
jgi:2-aminobenzoate-CoA ligase